MDRVEEKLEAWKGSLLQSLPVGGLNARNPLAYKWKATLRAWTLREVVFWRLHDLLTQSFELYQHEKLLGARILLRSGFETLATLIVLNQLMRSVIDGSLDFHQFSAKTSVLLLGSRDGSTPHASINIATILDKCDKRYPGIAKLYGVLSESAHPNYEGMVEGYSKVDHDERETRFSNRWAQMYGAYHIGSMELCMVTFEHEYDDVWPDLMSKLEVWLEANDGMLEATRHNL